MSNLVNYETLESVGKNLEYYGLKFWGKTLSYAQPMFNTMWGNCFEINEIIPGLYISDFSSACEKQKLKEIGITHIITALTGVNEMYPDLFKYYTIDICDRKYYDIKTNFTPCAEFINDALKDGGKVLVHCWKGASRSAAIVAAYLIAKKEYTCVSAVNLMKERRSCVNPNEGFIQQLMEYENEITKAKQAMEKSLSQSVNQSVNK
jgi:protein-tyrosine phosphatase